MFERDPFIEAFQKDGPAARSAFLDAACAGNAELRRQVERLLEEHDRQENSILDSSPPGAQATVLTSVSEGAGVQIGPYKLLQQIGEGGMGVVFMAEQTKPVERRVAIKIVKQGMESRQILARFDAERQALSVLDHPNIARVLDAGTTTSGRPYFVMELVKGEPITDYCDSHHLTLRARLELFIPVCEAVQHAHQKGIIHRDLKPSNVLIALYDGKPVPKVIDFGVAKATGRKLTEQTLFTEFGAVVGTLQYMSPEQASLNQLDIDTRSDIYSLGVLLYELLTGSTPLQRSRLTGAAVLEMLRIIRDEEPQKPSARLTTTEELPSIAANRGLEPKKLSSLVNGDLDWIVMKCLEKERGRRYETANGLMLDIRRYLVDEAVLACPPSRIYRLRKFVRRNKGHVIAASLLMLALLSGIAGTTIGLFEAKRQEALALAAAAQERDAKVREAERAEGERLAKLDAQAAAAAEKAAKEQSEVQRKKAERMLAFAKKGNAILGSVFTGLDPNANYANVGELSQALKANLTKAVQELEGSAIGDPLEVASMQHTLGLSLLGLGDPARAITLFEKARATRSAKLGSNHADTLTSMSYLAEAYHSAGKLDQALRLFKETLDLRKARLGADHPSTLTSMTDLAWCYREIGKRDMAMPLFEETLKLKKAKLGADDPDTLTSMNDLAVGYYDAGRPDLALPLLEETLKLKKAKLGPDHPDTFVSMNNLAMGYIKSGKRELALPLLQETLTLRKAKLGADHPDTLLSMNNLAMNSRAAGKLDQALPLLEETLKLRKAKQGADHPDTLTSMCNLGLAYQDTGNLGRALPLFQEAAAGVERRLFQHEQASDIVKSLIDCHERQGQLGQAESWRRKWLVEVKQRAGADSVTYSVELAALGWNLLQQKKWADAEPLLRVCLAIRQKRQPDAWATFNTQSQLGGALLGEKKHADAEPPLLGGYEGMKQRQKSIPGRSQVRLAEALDRLIEFYTATNKPDEAKKWQAERAKYPKTKPANDK
jgi:eukaryotic-like serine/threonine-protein kinase